MNNPQKKTQMIQQHSYGKAAAIGFLLLLSLLAEFLYLDDRMKSSKMNHFPEIKMPTPPKVNEPVAIVPNAEPTTIAEPKFEYSETDCRNCLIDNCTNELIDCVKVSGCTEVIDCPYTCTVANKESCLNKCSQGIPYEIGKPAKAFIMCKISMCGKKCFDK